MFAHLQVYQIKSNGCLYVSVNYKVELYDPKSGGFMPSTPGIGMHVEVRDPNDRILLSRVYSSEGMISFTSTTPGEHVICMYSNSTSWFSGSQLRVCLFILGIGNLPIFTCVKNYLITQCFHVELYHPVHPANYSSKAHSQNVFTITSTVIVY